MILTPLVAILLGNIPAEEMRFVLSNLPGGLTAREVDRMINTVDRNMDGRIRSATFRLKHFFRKNFLKS